jgi:hypothetical protein
MTRQADHSSAEVESARGQPKIKVIPGVNAERVQGSHENMSIFETQVSKKPLLH